MVIMNSSLDGVSNSKKEFEGELSLGDTGGSESANFAVELPKAKCWLEYSVGLHRRGATWGAKWSPFDYSDYFHVSDEEKVPSDEDTEAGTETRGIFYYML